MKRCPQCQNTYPDDVDFCMHEGAQLVPLGEAAPPPTPARKSYTKYLLGCGLLTVLMMGSCVAIYLLTNSDSFKKSMAEQKAKEEKEKQKMAEKAKTDDAEAIKILTALNHNFPSENSRKEMSCPSDEVAKLMDYNTGTPHHDSIALYADNDLLAAFASGRPIGPAEIPGEPWLSGPELRNWRPGDETAFYSGNLKHRFVVVFANAVLRQPKVTGEQFDGGDFRGWAVLFDTDNSRILAQTAVEAHSTSKVKYKKDRFSTGVESENIQRAIDEDFRDQFKDGLNQAVKRMCPNIGIDVSLP